MKKEVLIIFNNTDVWKTESDKLFELWKWFFPTIDLDIAGKYTDFNNIPFTPYDEKNYLYGIDPAWYTDNITPMSKGYDIVLFVVPVSQWKGGEARGWRSHRGKDGKGAVELHIGADEHERLYVGGVDEGGTFFNYARHEILHALYLLANKQDNTHKYWDMGKLEYALLDLAEQVKPKTAEIPQGILSGILAVIAGIRKRITELTEAKVVDARYVLAQPTVSVRDFALAIQRKEGWYAGSRSYRNNNPGNVKFVGQKGASADADGFAKFPSYKAGFDYLVWMITRAKRGESKVYQPDMTVLRFFAVYAPVSENDTIQYARVVREWLGVNESFTIKDLIV